MRKKGISLIVLVITIIIIIILAGAVILNLNQNNPVDKARVANVQTTHDSLKSGINLYIGNIMVKENGNHYASTMILGKNDEVKKYSIILSYNKYKIINNDVKIWELDYNAVKSKVNYNLDSYGNNSKWYIDEYGNPYLVYSSLEKVLPYLKTEDGSAILDSVSDFVIISDSLVAIDVQGIKITNDMIFDCQRSPAYPNAGDTFTANNFVPAYKTGVNDSVGIEEGHYLQLTKLGQMSDLTDNNLKNELEHIYPDQNYPVVRLDEYDENSQYVGKYSEGGILYEIDVDAGIYLLIAANIFPAF